MSILCADHAVGAIGVLIPEVVGALNDALLRGIHEAARALGYDVLIFTDTYNPVTAIDDDKTLDALHNIYQLAAKGNLDGILFAAGRFGSEDRRQEVYRILEQCKVPCLVLEEETTRFPYIFATEDESIRAMTTHLIRAHRCRDILCLTGPEGSPITTARTRGFVQAMQEGGLPCSERNIIYGDLWTEKPRRLAMDLVQGSIPMPEAIVCVSDPMAIALCDALTVFGVSVPDDIRITGYDGTWHSSMHHPSITTIGGKERQLGVMAVNQLYTMMTGLQSNVPVPPQSIRYGASCGCGIPAGAGAQYDAERYDPYVENIMQHYTRRRLHMTSDYILRMAEIGSFDRLFRNIDSYGYILENWEWLDICLCEDWTCDFEDHERYRRKGFSDRMYLALSKRHIRNNEGRYYFPTSALLPALQQPHTPRLVLFTTLCYDAQIFGYIATAYQNMDQICVDEHYLNWCQAVANGLHTLQNKMYQDYIRRQINQLSVHDPTTGLYNKRGLMEQLPELMKRLQAEKNRCFFMLISPSDRITGQLSDGIDSSLLLANALRLSADEEEITARLKPSVFMVIVPLDAEETPARYQQRRMELLAAQRSQLQGEHSIGQHPDYLTQYSAATFTRLSEIEQYIESMLQSMEGALEEESIGTADYRKQLLQLRNDIYANPQYEWGIQSISQNIGISVGYFHHLYKRLFGIGCRDDVISARMEKAKRLLISTDLRVQEIAEKCGYQNQSHFMRQFKQKHDISAIQYRKGHRKPEGDLK